LQQAGIIQLTPVGNALATVSAVLAGQQGDVLSNAFKALQGVGPSASATAPQSQLNSQPMSLHIPPAEVSADGRLAQPSGPSAFRLQHTANFGPVNGPAASRARSRREPGTAASSSECPPQPSRQRERRDSLPSPPPETPIPPVPGSPALRKQLTSRSTAAENTAGVPPTLKRFEVFHEDQQGDEVPSWSTTPSMLRSLHDASSHQNAVGSLAIPIPPNAQQPRSTEESAASVTPRASSLGAAYATDTQQPPTPTPSSTAVGGPPSLPPVEEVAQGAEDNDEDITLPFIYDRYFWFHTNMRSEVSSGSNKMTPESSALWTPVMERQEERSSGTAARVHQDFEEGSKAIMEMFGADWLANNEGAGVLVGAGREASKERARMKSKFPAIADDFARPDSVLEGGEW
jgi:hypothetical protein